MELTQRLHTGVRRDRFLNGAIILAVVGLVFSVASASRGQRLDLPVAAAPQLETVQTVQVSIPPTYEKLAPVVVPSEETQKDASVSAKPSEATSAAQSKEASSSATVEKESSSSAGSKKKSRQARSPVSRLLSHLF